MSPQTWHALLRNPVLKGWVKSVDLHVGGSDAVLHDLSAFALPAFEVGRKDGAPTVSRTEQF